MTTEIQVTDRIKQMTAHLMDSRESYTAHTDRTIVNIHPVADRILVGVVVLMGDGRQVNVTIAGKETDLTAHLTDMNRVVIQFNSTLNYVSFDREDAEKLF